MKKVGILTMYYNSVNYGGVLQAYALQKFLENNAFFSEQICFRKKNYGLKKSIKLHYNELGCLKTACWAIDRLKKSISSKMSNKLVYKKEKNLFFVRLKKFEKFRNLIPHSDKVYTFDSIDETNSRYDIFCCGSDQIWKPGVICPEYLLNFVSDNNKKISYAASISKTNISKKDISAMIPYLKTFDNISVREKYDKELLEKNLNNNINWVVDPTLLLEKTDWEKLYLKNIVNDDYIFCYLLEANEKKYKIINKFAKQNNLKIVTIPYANGSLNLKDRKFGDIHITDAGPQEFISLIHDAKLVITDSFHATVFSNIFNVNFYVLERTEAPTMNSRITSLLFLFDKKEKFIKDDELLKMPVVSKQNNDNSKYKDMKKKSIDYLLSALK